MRTRRWTRSPRGNILGVATGLAEWKGFPVDITRDIFFIIVLFTGIFPGLIGYLALAVILPEQTADDILGAGDEPRRKRKHPEAVDASFRETGRSYSDREKEQDWERRFRG